MLKKDLSNSSPQIPFFKAMLYIILSTVVVCGSALTALTYYKHLKHLRAIDDKYRIVAIVQTGPEKEALKTDYLAELLNLSHDRPTNLYRVDTREAEKKILSSSVIKSVTVKKIPPGTLYIDYTVRQPIAYLSDYKNAAVDKEGVAFPFKPFFTPKRLPEIYLGDLSPDTNDGNPLPELWGGSINGLRGTLALDLLNLLSTHCCTKDSRLVRLDVSKAAFPSCGQREIVAIFEDVIEYSDKEEIKTLQFTRLLRLSPENYRQELANYVVLRQTMMERDKINGENRKGETTIIDLRLPHLAFIETKNQHI